MTANGYKVFLGGGGDENVLELRWLIWHTLNVPKTIGLHT